MTRARRRADEKTKQTKRIKRRKITEKIYSGVTYLNDARQVGILKNHSTTCSCEMCGNPRRAKWAKKKDKLTIQERKHELERYPSDKYPFGDGDESILR